MVKLILKYFPNLNETQMEQFEKMLHLYPYWNEKINVISRKDIDNLESRHILHSLSIAKFIQFTPGTKILDFGTGGGFPGLPLAVLFPECEFHLLDRIRKKLRVVTEISNELGLENISIQHGDIAECKYIADFVVSRAVMGLPSLIRLCRKNISQQSINKIHNGVITLKGGDLTNEIKDVKLKTILEPLDILLPGCDDMFNDKYLTFTAV